MKLKPEHLEAIGRLGRVIKKAKKFKQNKAVEFFSEKVPDFLEAIEAMSVFQRRDEECKDAMKVVEDLDEIMVSWNDQFSKAQENGRRKTSNARCEVCADEWNPRYFEATVWARHHHLTTGHSTTSCRVSNGHAFVESFK
jgi:hypothetical protein